MVIIAAAVCAESGRVYLSRQFVEVSKARLEEHLSTFKLLLAGHRLTSSLAFSVLESSSVRFVYRKLVHLKLDHAIIVLLVTTKSENILMTRKCLQLTADLVKERCMFFDEEWMVQHALDLVLAFDEMVSMGGYMENVDVAAVAQCMDMRSAEEEYHRVTQDWQESETRKLAEQRRKEREEEARLRSSMGDTDVVSYSTFGSYTLDQAALKPSSTTVGRPLL